MATLQIISLVSTLVIFVVSALLAALLTRLYADDKNNISYLVWSAGLRFFSVAVILEILFSFGVYSDFLAKVYIFAMIMPLLAFSIGHIQYVKSEKTKQAYYYYSTFTAFFLLGSLLTSNIGNWSSGYAVYGSLPFVPLLFAAIIVVSSSIVLAYMSISSYISGKRAASLLIIPGAMVFGFINTVHISGPAMLAYYLELFGIMLLWLGIAGISRNKKSRTTAHQRMPLRF